MIEDFSHCCAGWPVVEKAQKSVFRFLQFLVHRIEYFFLVCMFFCQFALGTFSKAVSGETRLTVKPNRSTIKF